MSTNHRPQLESKRGKVIKIKDTIQHARGLPQQTSIKYRQDIKNEKTISKFNDLQKHDNNKITSLESISPPTKKLKIESTKEITTEPLNQEIDKQSKLLLKNDDQSDIQPNENWNQMRKTPRMKKMMKAQMMKMMMMRLLYF